MAANVRTRLIFGSTFLSSDTMQLYYNFFFVLVLLITHDNTPQLVGLLWMSHVAETST
jgi:hypothetical protein